MPFNKTSDLYFFTATVLNWKTALLVDQRKEIILDCLRFLKNENRIKIYGFVIMPNHIHLLWQNLLEYNDKWRQLTQGSLLKFTSNKILPLMDSFEKSNYRVNASDRVHQFWEREPLWVECYNMEMVEQKLNYIHKNPCAGKWMLADNIIEYKYSSAKFYETGIDDFGLLSSIYE
jgi:REP element-mobilizing transposase RayT